MAEVALDGVSKVFEDGTRAVDGMNLEIEDGEFMVLVGPSGCGKTTALRMVAGLEEITEGTLRIGDRIVNDLTPRERDIAMVFQSYALYPHLLGLRQHRVQPEAAQGAEGGDRQAGARRGAHPRSRAVPQAQAEGALGRPAAARCDGPGDRAPAVRRSSWTSRSRTSTPSCASRCGPRSASCKGISG